jgi:anion-transporting  ArsA/GET3 family ATPase
MIDEVLRQRAIIVTCGTGGVGKTTVSAALGMRAALLGRRAAVITIDPAKRLATSLGLAHVGDEPAAQALEHGPVMRHEPA